VHCEIVKNVTLRSPGAQYLKCLHSFPNLGGGTGEKCSAPSPRLFVENKTGSEGVTEGLRSVSHILTCRDVKT
jgi:hypothetical protein